MNPSRAISPVHAPGVISCRPSSHPEQKTLIALPPPCRMEKSHCNQSVNTVPTPTARIEGRLAPPTSLRIKFGTLLAHHRFFSPDPRERSSCDIKRQLKLFELRDVFFSLRSSVGIFCHPYRKEHIINASFRFSKDRRFF